MATRRVGLFCLAFGSGFAVLTIEIAGTRLIAPVFGLSVVPWTAVIGVILAALALGSHLGGRMADAGRVPLSRVLVVAGLSGVLPVLGSDFPWVARQIFGFIPGAVLTALILFAPPVLCLGAVVPYLVQADTESLGTIGRRAGDISAAATAGSIVGTFMTGFVLLPAMPLPLLLGVTAGALLLMAAASARLLRDGAFRSGGVVIAAIAIPAIGLLSTGLPADTLFAEQTRYASVEVTEREWADGRVVRELWQNGGSSSAEYVATGQPAHRYALVSLELLEPLMDRVGTVLVLGGAALTLPVAFEARRPTASIDVVEIDREVTGLAATYFEYGTAERPGISIIHDDARVFLRGTDRTYDLVYLDVFDHLLTVPWTMVTTEALRDMAARLGPNGVFAANVLSPQSGSGTEFLARFRATLEGVFPVSRLYLTDPTADPYATQNLIVLASNDVSALPDLGEAQTTVLAGGRPFTDMWAPVEYLQAKVFVQGLRWR